MYVNNMIAVKQLDIYDKVGKGVAHDEYIPFTINKGQILVGTQLSRFPGSLHVEFVKVGKVDKLLKPGYTSNFCLFYLQFSFPVVCD